MIAVSGPRRNALCFLAGCLTSVTAYADVLELEGTVKAVDASARTITIERKTPKGSKTLDLKVAKVVGDLSVVKVGNRTTVNYNLGLEVVTKLGINKPMSCRHLLQVLRRLEEHKDTKPENLPAAVQADHNFLFGYLMGIGDAKRDEFAMPTGRDNLGEFRHRLLTFLETHPNTLDDPAFDLVCKLATDPD